MVSTDTAKPLEAPFFFRIFKCAFSEYPPAGITGQPHLDVSLRFVTRRQAIYRIMCGEPSVS